MVSSVQNYYYYSSCCLKKYMDLLSIPQSGGEMSKRLGGIIGNYYDYLVDRWKTLHLCFYCVATTA